MDSSQQRKQRKLNLGPVAELPPNRGTRVRGLLKRGVTRSYAVTTGCARKGYWRMIEADELRLHGRRKSS